MSDHICVFVLHRACEDLVLWIICMKVFDKDLTITAVLKQLIYEHV